MLIALVANIETGEYRRNTGVIPGHPGSSSTDDVVCFFSIMMDQIGANFTPKQVQYAWRKICVEYQK